MDIVNQVISALAATLNIAPAAIKATLGDEQLRALEETQSSSDTKATDNKENSTMSNKLQAKLAAKASTANTVKLDLTKMPLGGTTDPTKELKGPDLVFTVGERRWSRKAEAFYYPTIGGGRLMKNAQGVPFMHAGALQRDRKPVNTKSIGVMFDIYLSDRIAKHIYEAIDPDGNPVAFAGDTQVQLWDVDFQPRSKAPFEGEFEGTPVDRYDTDLIGNYRYALVRRGEPAWVETKAIGKPKLNLDALMPIAAEDLVSQQTIDNAAALKAYMTSFAKPKVKASDAKTTTDNTKVGTPKMTGKVIEL